MYEGCTVNEVLAFRELEKEVFDFGEGPMKIEGLLGSEDAYYEMYLQVYFHAYNNRDSYNVKVENNKYRRLQIGREKTNKLNKECSWYVIRKCDGYLKRDYRGKRSGYLKKEANKKVRKYKGPINNGGAYKKIYPFWYNLF